MFGKITLTLEGLIIVSVELWIGVESKKCYTVSWGQQDFEIQQMSLVYDCPMWFSFFC